MALRFRIASLVCLALAGLVPSIAAAQTYLTKPIRMVVGFPTGSITDLTGRILAEHLRVKLGQPVVVDNKPGANGILGATEVARAQADGYTVLMSNSSTITVNPLLYKNLQYAPVRIRKETEENAATIKRANIQVA